MKRIGKRASNIIKALNLASDKMDLNFKLIKKYMKEGKKPDLGFKRNLSYVSYDFGKACDIKIDPKDDI